MSLCGGSIRIGSKFVYLKAPTGLTQGSPGLNWIDFQIDEPVPHNAVSCSIDEDGSEVYVGQATIDSNELLARIIPSRGEAFVFYRGEDVPVKDLKILVQKKLAWVENKEGRIPPSAVLGGKFSGEQFFIGKKYGAVGQVHSSDCTLRVTVSGEQMRYKNYEILVYE